MKRLASVLLIALSYFGSANFAEAKTYYSGPKGGCYSLSASGKKAYVSHQFCDRDDEGTNGDLQRQNQENVLYGTEKRLLLLRSKLEESVRDTFLLRQ